MKNFLHRLSAPNRNSRWAMLSGIAGMVGTITLLAFSLANEYQEDSKRAQIEVANITQMLEEHALATVQKADLMLREVQRNVRARDMRPARGGSGTRRRELHAVLKSMIVNTPEVAVVHVANASGSYIFSSLDPIPVINIGDRDYFKQQQNNATAGMVISPPLVSRTTGKWTLVLSRRINFEDGSFAGIVNIILNLEYFQQFYRTLDLGTQGVVAMYDHEYHLTARYPPNEKMMGQVVAIGVKSYIDRGDKSGIYHVTTPLDGVKRQIGFRQVRDLPLFVFAGLGDDDYLARWHDHIWQFSIGAFLFCLVVLGFVLRQLRAEDALRKSDIKSKFDEEEIKNLAFFDHLTGLPNRRLLQDRLQQALAACGRSKNEGAVLFIDLDNFKNLNDTLGHDIGDSLLKQVAQRLQSCVREGDTVARLGGDEFVVMLEDLSKNILEAAEQTETVGEKIIDALNVPYQLGIHEHVSTPSIGATMFNNNRSIEDLLKQADIAMYQAKKAGKNTLRFFDPRMQQSISARMALELELRNALEKRQFQLYYQIQVDSDRRPLGAEALIRWLHPERGLILPGEFIPMSEEIGLIFPIGWWVLETACAQLKEWQKKSATGNLVLSVNVSPKQFRQSDFVDQVHAAVKHYGINPALLKLELTESMLLENIEDTIVTMNAISKIGVRISLDDFGTGYSSLQYLKRLPLDQLKVDQSFVRDIATDSSDKAIVTTIIAMAHGLNLGVIAEGVETEEQRQFLENAGCSHYQGYLFSRPVPIAQFEELIKPR